MRKMISAEIKTKVALEAIKGVRTVNEVASMYEIHPNQVCTWEKQFLEAAPEVFPMSKEKDIRAKDEQTDHLYKKIGQLEVEDEFLKKVAADSKSIEYRRNMIEREHSKLSLVQLVFC